MRDFLRTAAPNLISDVEDFVRSHTALYVDDLRRDRVQPGEKQVNDPVWKTIRLTASEVAILDSPLLQRLRRIRQLGVAELTFPGAGYTRLEHAIGTVHTMALLCDSISRHRDFSLTEDEDTLLRCAALLHDVGHCAFSHVSEKLYQDFSVGDGQTFTTLRVEAENQFGNRPSASEILTAAIVSTDAFESLWDAANFPVRQPASNCLNWIATLVTGGFPDPTKPLFTQLLTGPFDADKLDYMSRDCLMAGIPLPTDVPRLIEKIRPVRARIGSMPEAMQRRFRLDPASEVTVLGVALSGGRAIEEMLVARFILFDKLYYHSKIRAAEGVIRRALDHITHAHPGVLSPGTLLALDDYQVLNYSHGDILSARPSGFSDAAARLLQLYRNRRLPKRSFAFSLAMRVHEGTVEEEVGWSQLVDDIEDAGSRTKIEDAIREKANELIANVGAAVEIQQDDVYVSLPKASRVHTSVETFLIDNDGQLVPFSSQGQQERLSYKHLFEVDRWADAYETNKALGHVMCADDAREFVHLASELVIHQKYGLVFDDGRHRFCKLSATRLEDLKRTVAATGVYDEFPRLLPPSSILKRSDVRVRIGKIASRLRMFQAQGGTQVDASRVSAFAAQLPEGQQEEIIDLLLNVQLFDRAQFVRNIREFVEELGDETHVWVPIGSPEDSASFWSYFLHDDELADARAAGTIRTQHLTPTLQGEVEPIVFFDDCVNSGGQIDAVFATWLGEEASLKEDHGDALPTELQEKLRDRDLKLYFAVGTRTAADRVQALLSERGLHIDKVKIGTVLPDDGLEGCSEGLRETLETIGYDLLRSTKPPERWSDERCKECALGYGGGGHLLVFPMNVPTLSLTALWSEGTHEGKRWLPLLPRRAK